MDSRSGNVSITKMCATSFAMRRQVGAQTVILDFARRFSLTSLTSDRLLGDLHATATTSLALRFDCVFLMKHAYGFRLSSVLLPISTQIADWK